MRMQLACVRKLVTYKYAYAYNWYTHLCPMYVHAYSSLESLIPFLFVFLSSCSHVLASVLT